MEEKNEEMINRLTAFIRKLCRMPYATDFILDKAFTYAIRLQVEELCQEAAMCGIHLEIDDMDTGTMEQAASWLEEAINSDNRLYQRLMEG